MIGLALTYLTHQNKGQQIMDSRTGDIYKNKEAWEKALKVLVRGPEQVNCIEMERPPTKKQLKRKPINKLAMGRVGRNEPCPCESGKKFKYCHLNI
jgi:hypothetical protein